MKQRDIFEALREIDPASGIDPQEAARIKARIRARVVEHAAPRATSRRRVWLVVAVAVFAAALIAAGIYVTKRPTQTAGIGCAQSLNLDSVYVISPSGPVAAEQCATLWADGIIVNSNIVPAGQIPALVGCVNEAGTLIAFPTDDQSICRRRGLTNALPPKPGTNTVVNLKPALVQQINSDTCPSFDDARRLITQALSDAGLDNWTLVIASPPTPDRPCPSLSFDGASRRITLVPVPYTGP